MIVRLGTAPRKEGLGPGEFQAHWRNSHADVVSMMPGLRRYQQFHAILERGEPLLPYAGFDACSALRFDSAAAMDRAFGSEEFLDAVQRDEGEFVDKSRFGGIVGTWCPDAETDLGAAGAVQVLTLVRAEDGVQPSELAARFASSAAGATGGAIVADHELHRGRFPVMADVVRIAGYNDVADALAGAAETRKAAGPARVVGEHLSRIVEVPLGVSARRPR